MKAIIIFIILILLSPITLQANKIQLNDNWLYVNSNDIEYNETNIDTIQIKTISDEFMAVSIVDTKRQSPKMPVSLIINETFDNVNIFIQIEFNGASNRLYLTQEGGFPLFSNEKLFGAIIVNITDALNSTHNKEYVRDFNNDIATSIDGYPSRAITTAETDSYIYSGEVNLFSTTQDNYLFFRVLKKYTLSSNQAITDSIRNYTLTPYYSRIYYYVGTNDNESLFSLEIITTTIDTMIELIYINHPQEFEIWETVIIQNQALSLNQYQEDALLFTFDTDKKLPVYIKQTEPAKISNSLTLSKQALIESVEYFLVDEEPIIETNSVETSFTENDITSEKSPLFAIIFIPTIILLIILKKFISHQI